MHIALVAAEPSGDVLGADLMQKLRSAHPELIFSGIGGPAMQAQGLKSLAPWHRFGHLGLIEVLAHLPDLWRIRQNLKQYWQQHPPDRFIGIDAPDFNLHLECFFKRRGIQTIHYVSPTVWAWRPKRVHIMRRCMDKVLCIFPFEPDFLKPYGISAHYVGHPLADHYPLHPDRDKARQALGLKSPILALLPGSRPSEIRRLAPIFLKTADLMQQNGFKFDLICPVVQKKDQDLLEQIKRRITPDLNLLIKIRQTPAALTAANIALIASGTATLEAVLTQTPMVVAYRLNPISHIILKKKLKLSHVSLANLLSATPWAVERIQSECQPQRLADDLAELWQNKAKQQRIAKDYSKVHRRLQGGDWSPIIRYILAGT